jgi:nitrogenase subunit NifH
MGLFVLDLWWGVSHWPHKGVGLMGWQQFLTPFEGKRIVFDLLGISLAGGMFVVPLYAFLTTTVAQSETARTIAANNIVNSAFMVAAAIILGGLTAIGVTVEDTLLSVAVSCVVSAWIAQLLHKACD